MPNKRIMHLAKLTISSADREKLTKHELALLSTLAFAVDEIAIFEKLFMQTLSSRPQDDDLVLLAGILENAIARVLSAKLYEALGLLTKYAKGLERKEKKGEDVTALTAFLQPHLAELRKLKSNESFEVAEVLRNHSTNHYIAAETELNLAYVSPRASFVAILDQMQGNSYYPFGEEVAFIGRLQRHFVEKHKRDFGLEELRAWFNWNMEVSRWLQSLFSGYIIWLRRERFPNWRLRSIKPYLEMELLGEIGQSALPVFFSADKYLAKKERGE